MNLQLSTEVLAGALRSLEKVTPAKAVLPILSHVLIRAHADHVTLSCTDTELALTRSAPAVVNKEGQVALPAKALLEIVSQITEPDVHLFSEKNGVRIASGHFKLRLQALDAEQFPVLATGGESKTLINGATLRALLRRVRPCISSTEKRYNINGALLILAANVIAVVTTDGKRLAVANASGPETSAQTAVQVILPTKLVDTLVQEDGDDYAFSMTENQIFFSTEQSILSSRVVDGKFPDYNRILDTVKPNSHLVEVARDVLCAALKRVVTVAGDSKIINFNVSNHVLQLQAKSAELGDAVENVAVVYSGDGTSVNLHASAIIDFLDAAQNASVTLSMGTTSSAVLLKDGANYLTIAMAVRA